MNSLPRFLFAFATVLALALSPLRAQSPVAAPAVDNKAAARAAFSEARTLFSSDMNACLAGIQKAIDLDPDYFEAHQYYILYSGIAASRGPGTDEEKRAAAEKSRAEVQAKYEKLAADHPDKAVYQAALGTLFEYSDPDRAQRCFQQAVKLNPKFGDAYDMLAICAEVRGNLPLAREYNRKAVDADPDNVTLWRHYVGSFVNGDVDAGVAAGLEMAKRFPAEGISIIGYLATRSHDQARGQRIWELLRTKFPAASLAGNLTPLFWVYLKSDPAKALALAREMSAAAPDNKQWPILVSYAQAVLDTDPAIAAGKLTEARAALDKIVLPRYGADRTPLDLAKARVTAAGEGGAAKAYAELMAVYVKTPSDDVRAALVGYGAKLAKPAAIIEAEVLAQRAAGAKPAIPFTLTNYRTGKPVSLEDYKGRVVLVNFWYPMCGPCRGEFPFLNDVLAKYRDRGFEILAINGHAPEDHMVLPLLDGWKLGFLPLNGKGDNGAAKDYKVRGFPSNFLYGPDGRIYYEPGPVSTLAAQRELELQIEALLNQPKA